MSTDTGDSFDDNWSWALKMQDRYAIDIYQHYWKVKRHEIVEIDALGEDEKGAKQLDYSGIDKHIGKRNRHIAQRFRTNSRRFSRDFSLRLETADSDESEYDKLMSAYRNGGNYPAVYAFGIGAATTQPKCLDQGLSKFYFIDMDILLPAIDSGEVEAVGGGENDDGSRGLYYDTDDLWAVGCIQDSITGSDLRSCWNDADGATCPTAPCVPDDDGQTGLGDFGGGDR